VHPWAHAFPWGPTQQVSIGAAHVRTSEMKYFDSRDSEIGVKHIMARQTAARAGLGQKRTFAVQFPASNAEIQHKNRKGR